VATLSLDLLQRDTKNEVRNDGLLYAQEGLEATRNIRDRDYLDLVNGDHGLQLVSDMWSFIAAPELVDNYYSRTITVSEVYRDGNGDIADTGTLDLETKKITSTVTWDWKGILPQSVSLSTYLTDWTGDQWIQTTCSEFTGGSFTQTETQVTASPPADNCALELLYTEGQSDFFCSVEAGSHGTDIVVSGNFAYFTTGNTNAGLMIADISELLASGCEGEEDDFEVEELDIGGKGRYLVKSGNTLYIGVQNSSKGLAVVDVTDPGNPSLVRQINVGGYGNQPMVSGTTLFMGVEKTSNSFVSYDISTPSNPSSLSSYNPGSATRTVEINGNYAYIGVDNSSSTLRVVDISNPSSLAYLTSLNLSSKAYALEYYSSVLYVGTDSSSSSLNVVNLSNPLSPSLSGSVNVSGKIQDMKVESGYLYAPTDVTNNSLAVLNVTTPLSPAITYYADLTGKGTGVDTTAENVFLSIDTANEGLVIEGTVNVQLASPGSYVSDVLDTGSTTTRYNFLKWEATVPPTGSVSFKIRTADSVAHLSTATWVGSDGTAATSYTVSPTPVVLSPTATGKRYAQIQVTMTSDGVSTPSLESITLDYNP